MSGLLNLFPIGLFLVLLWNVRRVAFNSDYLSLSTTKYFKGWFAIIVVLHHLSQRTSDAVLFHLLTEVGYLAVAVFFFFSAFGSQKRYMTVSNYASTFLSKRLSTIFVPYLVATVCYMFVQSCYGERMAVYRIFFPWEHGETLLPSGWFLFALAAFYTVFCGLMKFFKQNYKAVFWGVIVYCILWTIFCLMLGYRPRWIISTAALPFGVLCAWKEKQLTLLLERSYKYMLLVTSLGIYLMAVWFYWRKSFYVFDNINSILCVVMLLLFSAKFQIKNKALAFLGNVYLEVYLMQGIFMSTIPMRHLRTLISNDFLWCLLVLAGTIIGGYVLHKTCKKPLQMYQQKKKLIIQ